MPEIRMLRKVSIDSFSPARPREGGDPGSSTRSLDSRFRGNERRTAFVRGYLRGRLTSLTFGCAASFGNTVTILPDCHCTTVGNARVFWNLASNLAPKPVA